MTKEEIQNEIALILCDKDKSLSCEKCFQNGGKDICSGFRHCRISEKTEQQLRYVISSIKDNIFLRACAGSGKTEVVGMKAAYEIKKWEKYATDGIAVLTFTNDATDVIKDRIQQFCKTSSIYPHFVGTLSSFIHQYIAQPFGYKFRNFSGRNGDCTFVIIDKNLKSYKGWLENYRIVDIYAHRTYYDYEKQKFYIALPYGKEETIDEYFESEKFNKILNDMNSKHDNKYTFEDVRKRIKKEKKKFNSHGFANFEDMNNIAYVVLKNNEKLSRILARKFPLIIIDECQDLSWIELQILKKIMEYGSSLHFIGDLNQSVYEFKRVNPDNVLEFVKPFNKMMLLHNFRSCAEIVNFANKLIDKSEKITACGEDKCEDKALLYFEYKNELDVIDKYIEIIKRFNISKEKSCVIVKQNTMKDILLNINQDSSSLIITALQLWNKGNAYQKQKALECFGEQLSKWFEGGTNKKAYFCPKDIVSVFKWRIFLKSVLDDCCETVELFNFNQTYGKWHNTARKYLPNIIISRYKELKEYDKVSRDFKSVFSKGWLNAPSGKAKVLIKSIEERNEPKLMVTTVHGSKGCTYDSTLVVSSRNENSELGHWKAHWINGEGEAKRVGYVASTRAKYLLVWAIPTFTSEERKLIESYGFKNAEEILTI